MNLTGGTWARNAGQTLYLWAHKCGGKNPNEAKPLAMIPGFGFESKTQTEILFRAVKTHDAACLKIRGMHPPDTKTLYSWDQKAGVILKCDCGSGTEMVQKDNLCTLFWGEPLKIA